MEYEAMVQPVLDDVDRRIKENIRTEELARAANYSVHHFCRLFMLHTGTPVMSYVTRRKLEYALYDLSRGKRILDVAIDYGFETHAGFTKAFVKHFGYPPSLYRIHIEQPQPVKATIGSIKRKHGGIGMQVQIKEAKPLAVVGYASRHRMPGVSRMSDIPVFWDTVNMEYCAGLSTLHHTYAKSRHCEVGVCFDVDEAHECFTYMLGVGVDEADAGIPQRPGTHLYQVQGGLYAIFTTPLIEEAQYTRSVQETWKQILDDWLPQSKYEYDDSRVEYEYYDERDHAWLHDGKSRMDIFLPIRDRK